MERNSESAERACKSLADLNVYTHESVVLENHRVDAGIVIEDGCGTTRNAVEPLLAFRIINDDKPSAFLMCPIGNTPTRRTETQAA